MKEAGLLEMVEASNGLLELESFGHAENLTSNMFEMEQGEVEKVGDDVGDSGDGHGITRMWADESKTGEGPSKSWAGIEKVIVASKAVSVDEGGEAIDVESFQRRGAPARLRRSSTHPEGQELGTSASASASLR